MLPLKPTAGTTGRAGKDGYGVALVHSSCGGRLGRGEELSWRGELDGGGGGHICVGGRPSAATWVDSLDLPPPPTLIVGGLDLGRRQCPRWLPAADLHPGRSSGRAGRQLWASHRLAPWWLAAAAPLLRV
jgi:hypothetical protein